MASAPETCCICLTKYTEEVTLRCGHSVCQGCIDQFQDTQAESKVNFCPKCKEPEEHPSPNTWTWRNEVEELPSSQASLCDDHLRVHIKSPEHVLSKPTTVLEEQKCSVHKKILEYYCNEDETCICVYCLAETHRTHQLEPLNEATEKRKERLKDVLQTLDTKREKTDKEIQNLLKRQNEIPDKVVTFLDGVKKNDAEETDKNIHSSGNLNHFLIALTIYDGLDNIVTKAKEDFYVIESSEILLDKSTAANNVAITEDLKSATWSVMSQRRKETPKRFQQYQVFSIQGILSGQHYWEVEASEAEYWMVGMAYPSMETKGEQSWIGNNKRSWCFCRWHEEYSIRHNSKDIQLFSGMSSNRYGIHVDYDSGQLSFYHLCEPIRHLYTFSGTFTEPLHAAFWVNDNGWIKIRKS
ncbi:E3 ubiquitin-protein ligase TRIM39-like [Bufo gargarizans]|uniref:E3 ubiquitin-protein ligase TRIM39-like n=1 Tax=Bufo gargarizans TaxID=30331 RepID=UPI001CF45F87|nr:E3 ubiquitin-protein ligase TRIM39-like [Bufo gargarizans]